MNFLGINVGSSSLKMVLLQNDEVAWSTVYPHDGDVTTVVHRVLNENSVPSNTQMLVTGTEGRYLFNANNAIEPLCIEAMLEQSSEKIDAVVSMGGEDLVVYTISEEKHIVNNFSGSKCASGTGEFFKQQLGRMDMTLNDVNMVSESAKVKPISSRCSVFMKSDCTHKLNKHEATKDDIVVSLSFIMASKVLDFLKRARIDKGNVLLIGGVSQNKHILRFMKEHKPGINFIVPESAAYYEALGAAWLAKHSGTQFLGKDKILRKAQVKFSRFKSLQSYENKVKYFSDAEEKVVARREYILGVDGGSTTTKACLIDIESKRIVASHYGRTHGDPVKALKNCIAEIQKKIREDIGDESIEISLSATTGSSREILGVFLETGGIYNEIIAHAYGTTYFSEDVDTIFEIGGQDAKYVLLKNKVPIDYAMNEACSAGTGSFLEESASGDLNIRHAYEIGDIAIKAEQPLKFGEHCSAFINSDIRKAIQQGATIPDITAGIVTSIVSNYLNRVVGNRTIGNTIFLQGGVAKNKAVPLAFAMLLEKEILVPPSPELMGCFGVGLLAKEKHEIGLLQKKAVDLDAILNTDIVYERVFVCKSCDNLCPIQVLNVNEHKYMFGGRCNKYANRRKSVQDIPVFDYIEKRNTLLYQTYAPSPDMFVEKKPFTVGIPKCFSVHSLYPLYSWFFHELGIKAFLSDNVEQEGIARVESTYCFPAEIAHGAVQDILNQGADYIFLPHFRDMPSYEKSVHANFCPITQGLPYYIKKAFPEIGDERILPLVVSFKFGKEKALEYFKELGKQLNISANDIRIAFEKAYQKQDEYYTAARRLGIEALEEAKKAERPVIALLGRPYNAFTKEANMGIPRKFTTRGFSIIPFDILPYEKEEIFDNMYWYYGQQDMKAAQLIKDEPNIFVTFITNFSCAPDSFLLHYLKWLMGTKPFLILELDSHSADAGIDTRVEAFLDIIDGYRSKLGELSEDRYDNGLEFVNTGSDDIYIRDRNNHRRIPVKGNKKVKLLLSNMGNFATELLAATLRNIDYNAEAMPLATPQTLQIARSHASGKECVPSHLVLGSALQYFASEKYRKDEIYLLFVPITTGPCRTGQYFVYYQNLFRDLRLENVVVFTLSADNSYTELGQNFSKHMWQGLVVADYMKDVHSSLLTCAEDKNSALDIYDREWRKLIGAAEKDINSVLPVLEEISYEIAKIPLKKQLEDLPKILIVGEIYVRRDDFAVDELVQLLASRGIVPKVSGVAEWIHYLDFVREYDLKKRIRLEPWWRKAFSNPLRKLVQLRIEEIWKHAQETKVKNALKKTKLLPHVPHDMKKIMANTAEHFVNHELNSEIAVSSGVAATAMEEGYSGIINISPFACLIGRVIEGILTPWARDRNYPMMSVEVDGNLLPPNLISKLNIFIVNVLRFKQNPELFELIEESELDEAENLFSEKA